MSHSSKIIVKERIPFSGKGVDDVVAAVRHILSTNKNARKLTLEAGKPFLLEKLVSEEEADVNREKKSLYDIVRNLPMVEHQLDEEKTPLQNLWDIVSILHGEMLDPVCLLIGDKFRFQRWMKVQIPVTRMSFFGITIKQLPELESDVFIFCGSENQEDGLEGIQLSVKAALP
jgi:hypothetical protein